ncbi:unnamed protein product [Malus baccata var. baccata]
MDKSWLTIPRNFEAYTAGINLFLDQAVANGVGPDKFRCPCKRCCNRYTFVKNTIIEHLILYDMDKDYKNACWRHHGEQNIGEQNVAIGEEETGDEVIGMHDFLNDVLVQPLTEEGVGPSIEPSIGERRPEEVETFFRFLEKANQDLWLGCKEFKKLKAVVRLYQIKCLAGMPDEIFTTLLKLIKRMLPEGDCLPESCYKAKKLINDLGLTVVGTLLGIEKSKDGLATRADLEVLNIRRSQHPRRKGNRTFLPLALFTLKREEKTAFCNLLSTIRVPDGYSSNLSRCVHVNERKIHGLKNHDCHVLMQQLLPLAIRPILPKAVTMVLLELSAIFRQLCSKNESEEGFKELSSRIALTLCQLEKIFPPAFFNIMVHLPVHLADEAALAGHVPYRWMYPIERYLQTLKRYVRNKGRPEGSIAEAYLVDKCLSFCSMYLRGENVELDLNVLDQCHRYILNNCDEVNPFRRVVDMFEVKYCGLTEAGDRGRAVMLFKCELVNSESPRGMKTGQYGFTMAIPNLNDRILDNENFHTRVGVEETHFLESLALPTEFVNHANVDDELTDDDGE